MANSPGQPPSNRPPTHQASLSRRRFLGRSFGLGAGAVARSTLLRLGLPTVGAGTLLAACGTDPVPPTVVPLFSPDRVLAAGLPQRIPIAIVAADAAGGDGAVVMPNDDDEITVTIRFDGAVVTETSVAGRVVDHDHVGEPDPNHQHAQLFRYYPLRATLPEPGIYDLTIEVVDAATGDTAATELPIQAFDRSQVEVPLVGEPMPAVTTPTFDDSAGVDRLCTRLEPCPFHERSATASLADGRPLALLVATPAFCSTAYCGPVLETVIEESANHPGIDIVHVEVYANTTEVDGNYLDPRIELAPAVAALRLGFEPSLFLVDGDGVLVDRIDNIFDRSELAAALSALA